MHGEPRQRVVLEARERGAQARGRVGLEACHQHVGPRRDHALGDRDHLLGRLPLAEDRLREPVAQAAVVVDAREPEILVGQLAQPGERLVHRGVPRPHGGEQVGELPPLHVSRPPPAARARHARSPA